MTEDIPLQKPAVVLCLFKTVVPSQRLCVAELENFAGLIN